MRKIHDFSSFSALYESDAVPAGTPTTSIGSIFKDVKATEASKLYDQTLGLILTTALNSYSSELTFPTKSYDANIDADMATVKSAPIAEKAAALKKIMEKVKAASGENTTKGAPDAIEAWVAAGSKAADALEAMVNQYKDQPEELTHINDYVNAKIDSYLKGIQDSAKSNDLKGLLNKKNESSYYRGSDEIFEGILQGKKGLIEDVSKQVTLVTAKLASLAQTPGMTAEVQKLQTEVNQIAAKMGALLDKKNSEINKDDVKKAAERLAEIPTEADKIAEKMLKQDATNKEASAILVQALGLVQDAKDKEIIYLGNKEVEDKNSKENLKATVVEYNSDKANEENPKVKEFQQLVTDKFKGVKAIANLPDFKKMGTDGKFGPGTAEMVKIMKSGYDLENPSSPDITNALFAELKKNEEIKESRILSFDAYAGISEAFDTGKAVAAAKKSSSASKGGGSKGVGGQRVQYKKSLLFKKGSTGNAVVAINRIVGQKSDEKTYTEETADRVKDFQKLNNLYVDGIAGEDTITALFNTRDAYKGEPKPKLNDEEAARGPWAYKMLASILGQSYQLPEPEKNKVSSDIGEIFKSLVRATQGGGTDEVDFVKAIKKIKTVDDVKVLNAMFDQAARNKQTKALQTAGVLAVVTACFPVTAPFTGAAALGTFIGAELSGWNYYSLAGVINGEFGVSITGDDTAYVQQIAEHLNKIGAKASFEEANGEFIEDSFRILV